MKWKIDLTRVFVHMFDEHTSAQLVSYTDYAIATADKIIVKVHPFASMGDGENP